MKPVRTVEAIQAIREACQVAASVLAHMVDAVEVGVNTYDLDQLGRKLIAEHGAESACFNYRHQSNVFPAYTCISVNEEIVHGIGRLQRVIAPGDLVSLDVVVRYRGLCRVAVKIWVDFTQLLAPWSVFKHFLPALVTA